jgi:hypothetical protein
MMTVSQEEQFARKMCERRFTLLDQRPRTASNRRPTTGTTRSPDSSCAATAEGNGPNTHTDPSSSRHEVDLLVSMITIPTTCFVYIGRGFAEVDRKLRGTDENDRTDRKTLRVELRTLGVSLRSSTMARAAVDLARRWDADPGDRSVTMLSRELRLVLQALHTQLRGGAVDDVEEFLRRVSTPAFDAGH